MVAPITFTTRRHTTGMVITHLMLWTLFVSLLLIFINAYESVNGAGYLHWTSLIVGLMGLSSQATTLITQLMEELS